MNPYNPCFANKNINSIHITITWHVDYLKVSHKDAFETTKFGMWLEGIYG